MKKLKLLNLLKIINMKKMKINKNNLKENLVKNILQ